MSINITYYGETELIPVFDYNWERDLNSNKNQYVFGLIAIALNIIILVISKIKKRENEQTYRIIILYIVWMAIVRDICRIMGYFLFYNLFSRKYLFTYLLIKQTVWFTIMGDSTLGLISYAQIAMLMLFPLFALNRYFAMIHPITFSIHMTTKRVHIYCNAIIAFVLIGYIYDMFAQVINNTAVYDYIFVIAFLLELLITPITSIWIIVKLLLHIRVLTNLHDRNGIIEMILISLSLLIQSIYAIVVILPAFILDFWVVVDPTSYIYAAQHSSSLFLWVSWGSIAYSNGPDTMFYALNLLIVVRIYSSVVVQIPLFIYRKTCKPTNQVAIINVIPMTSMNNNNP